MKNAWRGIAGGVALVALVVACSSSNDGGSGTPNGPNGPNGPQPARTETEVARQEIGPAGGTLSGAGATIEIPAGAVPANTTIIVKTVDPASVTLPTSTALAGTVYSFAPDDVQFLKPVTIRVALDPAKKPASGKGAIVLLRSATADSQWLVKGASSVTQTEVTATTDHFSDWAPGIAAEGPCFLDYCTGDAGPGGIVNDCRVPASGPGVACHGVNGSFTCACDGQSATIATFTQMPSSSELSALAVACGATCAAVAVADAATDAPVTESCATRTPDNAAPAGTVSGMSGTTMQSINGSVYTFNLATDVVDGYALRHLYTGDPTDQTGYVLVVLTPYAKACGNERNGIWKSPSKSLELTVQSIGTAITTKVYSGVQVGLGGSAIGPSSGPSCPKLSGSGMNNPAGPGVTITAIDATHVAGTFDITPSGQSQLVGTFDVPFCARNGGLTPPLCCLP